MEEIELKQKLDIACFNLSLAIKRNSIPTNEQAIKNAWHKMSLVSTQKKALKMHR